MIKTGICPLPQACRQNSGCCFPSQRRSRRSLLHGYPRPWQLSSQGAAPPLPLLWGHSRGFPSCDTSAGKEVREEEEGNKGRLHLSPCCPCAGHLCFGPQLPGSSSAPTLLSLHCQTLKATSAQAASQHPHETPSAAILGSSPNPQLPESRDRTEPHTVGNQQPWWPQATPVALKHLSCKKQCGAFPL